MTVALYQAINFTPGMTFTALSEGFDGIMVGFAVLAMLSLAPHTSSSACVIPANPLREGNIADSRAEGRSHWATTSRYRAQRAYLRSRGGPEAGGRARLRRRTSRRRRRAQGR